MEETEMGNQAIKVRKSCITASKKVMALAIICVSEGDMESTIRKIERATGWKRCTVRRFINFLEKTDSPKLYLDKLAGDLSGHLGEYASNKIFAASVAAALTIARSL